MDQHEFEDAQRRLALLSCQPVKGRAERRERDRQITQTIMQITDGIGDTYWQTAELVKTWTDETDALDAGEATKRFEGMLNVPEAVPSDWVAPDNDSAWMAERSSFVPRSNTEEDEAS